MFIILKTQNVKQFALFLFHL